MKKLIALLSCLLLLAPMGCGTDQVIAGLSTAHDVAVQAQSILATVNPQVANIAGNVATDLAVIVKTYADYDKAAPGDKPSVAQLILATSQSISNNLAAILDAVRVKNPHVLTEVTVAVAVINSALTVMLSKVTAAPPSSIMTRGAAINGPGLPIIQNAKSAKDLKDAWNHAVERSFPHNKI